MRTKKTDDLLFGLIQRTDPRLLLLLCPLLGLAVWSAPWPWLAVLPVLAIRLLLSGVRALPWFRKFLKGYLFFAIFWLICAFLLLLLNKPGSWTDLLAETGMLALRFVCLPGLALPLLLAGTPIALGRACAWYASGFCALFLLPAGLLRPRLCAPEVNPGWQAGLAVALTISMLPRIYRDLSSLQHNLALRAPGLKTGQKVKLLCLAALRLFGEQTWEQSLALVGRRLDQPAVWAFQRKDPAGRGPVKTLPGAPN